MEYKLTGICRKKLLFLLFILILPAFPAFCADSPLWKVGIFSSGFQKGGAAGDRQLLDLYDSLLDSSSDYVGTRVLTEMETSDNSGDRIAVTYTFLETESLGSAEKPLNTVRYFLFSVDHGFDMLLVPELEKIGEGSIYIASLTAHFRKDMGATKKKQVSFSLSSTENLGDFVHAAFPLLCGGYEPAAIVFPDAPERSYRLQLNGVKTSKTALQYLIPGSYTLAVTDVRTAETASYELELTAGERVEISPQFSDPAARVYALSTSPYRVGENHGGQTIIPADGLYHTLAADGYTSTQFFASPLSHSQNLSILLRPEYLDADEEIGNAQSSFYNALSRFIATLPPLIALYGYAGTHSSPIAETGYRLAGGVSITAALDMFITLVDYYTRTAKR